MAEYPILFNGEMVRAVLDGRKTQTRRVMKPQPKPLTGGWMYDRKYFADDAQMKNYLFHDVYGEKGSPYGSAYADGTGDLLWVRETWHPTGREQTALYRADGQCEVAQWKPSIHMPRWASRITLRVTDVRVERVQELEESEIGAEGIERPEWWNNMDSWINGEDLAKEMFAQLWNSINAARGHSWQSNPWVWVVEFEKVTP